MKKRIIITSIFVSLLGLVGVSIKYLSFEAFSKAYSQQPSQSEVKLEEQGGPNGPVHPEAPHPPTVSASPAEAGAPAAAAVPGEAVAVPGGDVPAVPVVSPQDDLEGIKLIATDGVSYDPTGRKDPFKSFIPPKVEQAPPQQSPVPGYVQPSPVFDQPIPGGPTPGPIMPGLQPTLEPGEYKYVGPSIPVPRDFGGPKSLEAHELSSFKLVGIMWEVREPKAMIQSTVFNKVFMVKKMTRIGNRNGYVAAIREGEVVVVELLGPEKTPSTKVLTLQK